MGAPFGKASFSIVEAQRPTYELLRGAFENEVLAIRIPDWTGDAVKQRLLQSTHGISGIGYVDEPTFLKVIGGALYSGANDRHALADYFENVPAWNQAQREACDPYISPAEKLIIALRENWPGGCNAEFVDGKPTFSGLIRRINEGGEAGAHQDMVHWDLPDCASLAEITATLSAVSYPVVPESGGELELWSWGFQDRDEYARRQIENDYRLDRERIGEPQAVLTPRAGELILFNPQRIHAVRPVTSGCRITQSLFIAYRDRYQSLTTFS